MRLFLAILLLSSTQLATQMILPALPDIAAHFQLSEADTQQIIMLYFISFGLSQLFYGPWVDAVGRRKVFYTGLAVFLIGSLFCSLAVSPDMLALGRVLQGLGAGSPLILSRVILSATMSGDRLKKAYGSLAIAASMTSIAAPFLGGVITTEWGWQLAFSIFTGHLLVALMAGYILLPVDKATIRRLSFRSAVRDYVSLLGDTRFVAPASFKWIASLMFLSLGTFLPFEMQRRFAMSAEQYGMVMTIPVFGLLLGSSMCRMLQRYYSSETIIALFWPLVPIAGAILMFYPPSVSSVMVAISLFMVLSGAYYASSLQLVMEPFKEKGGTASALMGSIDMCAFSLVAALVNRFWVKDLQSLGELFVVCSILIAISWLVLRWERSRDKNDLCLADNNIN